MLRGRLLLCSGPHDLTGFTLVAFLLAGLVPGVHFYALLLVLLSQSYCGSGTADGGSADSSPELAVVFGGQVDLLDAGLVGRSQ